MSQQRTENTVTCDASQNTSQRDEVVWKRRNAEAEQLALQLRGGEGQNIFTDFVANRQVW
jgi:hypothetical protein